MDDITLMRLALAEAEKAAALGEVPVGAVKWRDEGFWRCVRGRPARILTHHAELTT